MKEEDGLRCGVYVVPSGLSKTIDCLSESIIPICFHTHYELLSLRDA